MAKCSGDFERFLYANYPDDYRRATVDGVADDVLTAILSKHRGHYEIWCGIPEWVKNKYGDRLPKELLNGNTTVKDFVEEETAQAKAEDKQLADMADYGVTLLALGYAADTAAILCKNRAQREQLLQEAKGKPLNEEQLAKWLSLRESDRDAILKDWKDHQPEKYLLHLVKELNRAHKRADKGDEKNIRAGAGMKVASVERELKRFAAKLDDKGVREKMATYLRREPQQAALRHLSPEILQQFTLMMAERGIKIEQVRDEAPRAKVMSRGVLAESLRQSFEDRKSEARAVIESGRKNMRLDKRVSVRGRQKSPAKKQSNIAVKVKLGRDNVQQSA